MAVVLNAPHQLTPTFPLTPRLGAGGRCTTPKGTNSLVLGRAAAHASHSAVPKGAREMPELFLYIYK